MDAPAHWDDVELPTQRHLSEYVFKDLDKFGDREAFIDASTGKSVTFARWKSDTNKVASGLCALGYKKGDCVLIYSRNHIEYATAYHGILSMGGIATTCNPDYTPREIAHQIKDANAISCITTSGECLKRVQDGMKAAGITFKHIWVLPDMQDEIALEDGVLTFDSLKDNDGTSIPKDLSFDPKADVCALPYSSGTTGLSKGVMLTHFNVMANMAQFTACLNVGEADTFIAVLPMYHIYAQALLLNSPMYGCRCVVLPKFDPALYLSSVAKYKATVLHIVPPLVIFLAKHPVLDKFDMSSVHTIFSGAAPLTAETAEAVVTRFPHISIRQGYGMSELSPVSHVSPEGSKNYGSCGYRIPNTECRVQDVETKEFVGPNTRGELLVKGPQVMLGYLNNPEATKITIDDQGFLHTGDIAYFDDDGQFYIVDRLKELIKHKGFQVPPAELEGLLLEHENILDAAVIGIPNERAGELPRAYVVLKPGVVMSEDDVKAFISDKVVEYKRLSGGVVFIDKIPKSASGKILRRELKAQALAEI